MKIISLNTWGGRAGKENLLEFFRSHKGVDIFCLQEIWSAPYPELDGTVTVGGTTMDHSKIMVYGMQEISAVLPDHVAYFRPHNGEHYGLLMLIKKDIKVIGEGDVFVYQERGYVPEGDIGGHARNIQYATVETSDGPTTIINFHGLWNGMGKGDSEDRLTQSDKILAFTQKLKNSYLICGDFNLRMDTESLKKFEDAGLRNLIRENNITSTRTSFYNKPEKHADYALVSERIDVQDFKVLPDEVSDHSPLYLEVDIIK